MNKKIVVMLLIAGLLLTSCSGKKTAEQGSITEGNTIVISGFAFSPGEITVNKGDKVKWINQDDVGHTVTSDAGRELSSGLFGNGESYEHVFDNAGEYGYFCEPHPYMKGKVIVT